MNKYIQIPINFTEEIKISQDSSYRKFDIKFGINFWYWVRRESQITKVINSWQDIKIEIQQLLRKRLDDLISEVDVE